MLPQTAILQLEIQEGKGKLAILFSIYQRLQTTPSLHWLVNGRIAQGLIEPDQWFKR